MNLFAAILAVLLALPGHSTDTETSAQRLARLTTIAQAIDTATLRAACEGQPEPCRAIQSDRVLMAALLLAKGKAESGFAQYVHEGRCSDGPVGARCDSDKQGVPRAHGLWQAWRVAIYPPEDWDAINESTDAATTLAAWHAARSLSGGFKACLQQYPGDPIASAIAQYAGSCLQMAPAKVRQQAQLTRRFQALLYKNLSTDAAKAKAQP